MPATRHTLVTLALAFCAFACGPGPAPPPTLVDSGTPVTAVPDDADASRRVDSLRAVLADVAGEQPYIVIDRTRNALSLRGPDTTLVEAVCATGSGKILLGEKRRQTWHFETPKRTFTVLKKVTDPIWKKPVWAFVEKNEAAPVLPWSFRRLDGTTLGDYALELENSFAIHGTLYPNLLGRNITHGCVRLDADALAAVYRLTPVGTPVYVF